ncbi:MAG: hypothetical protein NTU47_01235 [Ignavibacteriales bacterium]|nr:hypothetical protein [Ignavibacteriales bacterium]
MDIQFFSNRQRPVITLLFVALMLGGAPENFSAGQVNPEVQTDPRSIESLLKAFYESLSFPEGKSPDWDRWRSLFASAISPCIRIAGDSVMQIDRERFIAFFGGRIKNGTLRSFREKEIGRTGEYYGRLAQIFSAYQKEMNLADGGKPIRGINSFHLLFKDNRWWITSVTWQDESPDNVIPEKYLKQP